MYTERQIKLLEKDMEDKEKKLNRLIRNGANPDKIKEAQTEYDDSVTLYDYAVKMNAIEKREAELEGR